MATDIIDPPAPSPRSWPLGLLVAIGVMLLFTPAAAFVLGERAKPIENRALAELPETSDGWRVFPQLTAWATDHLPLRADAITVNDRLVEGLFGQPPVRGGTGGPPVGQATTDAGLGNLFPRVIVGDDGWLYYGFDMKNPCLAEQPVEEIAAELDDLREVVERSGRRFVFVVAPNKSTVIPEHLPDSYPGDGCAAERRDELWKALERLPGRERWLVDLRVPLLERQAADGVAIYRKTDTHWTPRGGAVLGQELMARLQPGLTDFDDVVRTGERERRGDLAVLLGRDATDTYALWEVRRPGVVQPSNLPPPPGKVPLRLSYTTTGAPLFEPRTLLLGDSVLAASRPSVYPLFAHLTVLHTLGGAKDQALLAEEAVASDVIVIEVVERDLVSDDLEIISEQVRTALRDALR